MQTSKQLPLFNPIASNEFYDCIAIDPPWQYDARVNDKTHRGRMDYPTMPIKDILALSVNQLAADNAVLWLWVTNSFLQEGFQCLDAWGFQYKTVLTWVKMSSKGTPHIGLGNWLRNATEQCLFAVKGDVKSFSKQGILKGDANVIFAPRREHSRKPEEFYELVSKLSPEGKKLEMFSRQRREGWDVWGLEVDKFSA